MYSLPPEKPLSQTEKDMINDFLAKRTEKESKEAVELANAKEKLKTLSVEQLVKITGHTENYCYRLKRGDEAMSQKLIKKLGV